MTASLFLVGSCAEQPVAPPARVEQPARVTSNGSLFAYWGYNWSNGTTVYDLPPVEGSHVKHVDYSPGIYAAQLYSPTSAWFGDTLFRSDFERWDFGSSDSGCEFTGSGTNPWLIYTTNGSCLATWLDARYTTVRVQIDYPLVVTVSGPTSFTSPGTYYWTASASGGITGSYHYSWFYKADGASNFSDLSSCGGTSCSLSLTVGSPSFTILAQASTTRHTGNVATGETRHVSNYIPDPPNISISGPASVTAWTNDNWVANVTGGLAPLTYGWAVDGVWLGNTSSISTALSPGNHTLEASVTDALNRSATAYFSVYSGCEGQECPFVRTNPVPTTTKKPLKPKQ